MNWRLWALSPVAGNIPVMLPSLLETVQSAFTVNIEAVEKVAPGTRK